MNHKEVLQDCEREFSLTPTISQRKRSYQAAPRLNREMEELIFPRERFRFHLFHITCTCDAYCMCSCCIFCHHTFCRKKTITVENSVFETTTVKKCNQNLRCGNLLQFIRGNYFVYTLLIHCLLSQKQNLSLRPTRFHSSKAISQSMASLWSRDVRL